MLFFGSFIHLSYKPSLNSPDKLCKLCKSYLAWRWLPTRPIYCLARNIFIQLHHVLSIYQELMTLNWNIVTLYERLLYLQNSSYGNKIMYAILFCRRTPVTICRLARQYSAQAVLQSLTSGTSNGFYNKVGLYAVLHKIIACSLLCMKASWYLYYLLLVPRDLNMQNLKST